MSGDMCETQNVVLQENGIIRDKNGEILGRLIQTEVLDELNECKNKILKEESKNDLKIGEWDKCWQSPVLCYVPNGQSFVAYTIDDKTVLTKLYDPNNPRNFNSAGVKLLGFIRMPKITQKHAQELLNSCPLIRK